MSDYTNWSDTDLIAACRQRSQGAWNTLVQRYSSLVYTIPRRYGLTQPEVEDIFQSVWLLLLQHLDSIDQPERLSAWLVTTAKRESWKLRRGAAYTKVEQTDPESLQALPAIDQMRPEEIVLQYEHQQSVRRALAELDERCYLLLYLLYYDPDRPSYAAIAERLGLAVGSIGPIRARCLTQLARLLENEALNDE